MKVKIDKIKKSLPYLLLSMSIYHFCYFFMKGIHSICRYLADKLDMPLSHKIIEYPKPKKEEDILGI
tara:strand:- start:671 stop:871 length:201 start_codon:yes stop_codon:yes gene_type:complete